MLRPCDPDTTIQLLRLTLTSKPEDVELELVFDLVAQLVTDLNGWVAEDFYSAAPAARWLPRSA